ncbi:MAG: ABC transporter ATP-binding protein [Yoonia sp.]|uniref:ABC transporter ATP-binding protein n=1 Tax=Yoonia sp. TaxID=2212373 RepID=UPI003EF181D2
MLEVRNLSVNYGQHRALDNAAIRLDRGEIVVILGANGAGKSTLLKAISGICEGKVTGEVTLGGTDLTHMPADQIVEEGVALVPEGRGVFGELTVRENLTLGAYGNRARDEEAANLERVYQLFPKLIERGGQVVRTMSGGEQQMVAIGRAMMSNPQVLTLDEPSLGLSPLLCKELFANLKLVRDLGIGILLVEQNAKQSLAIADRGYLLENAHIVHEDTASKLRADPAVQAAYLGAGRQDDRPAPKSGEAHADPPARTLPTFELRPAAQTTRSADAVLGQSVADLVARAATSDAQNVANRRQRLQSGQTRQARTSKPAIDTAAHGDRLTAALHEIEAAAARARRNAHRTR